MKKTTEKKIILFDGVCNLCNGAVLFVIKRDPDDVFRFAALQSDKGQALAQQYGIDTAKVDSIILIENGKSYTKSSAALRIAKHLKSGYRFLSMFLVIPAVIRNWVYDFIAKNRYNWYGKKDQCMIPTPALQSKFL
ncbi:MAG: thiol-disulfide oxidoreductase DCC family protein [Dokdonia sp.]|jgi:predicted DCC family thiol-disulfide oxidoreductase YuxK